MPERERDRRDEEVDHRRAVHREELVVAAARGDLHPRLGQLGAHEQCEHAAGQEEPERRGAQAQRDALVVGAHRQPDEAADRRERRCTVALMRPTPRPRPARQARRIMASTKNTMSECFRPQYCAQCPTPATVPAGKRRSKRAVLPGQASRLKRRSGIQKACTTSRVRNETSTLTPAGTCSVAGPARAVDDPGARRVAELPAPLEGHGIDAEGGPGQRRLGVVGAQGDGGEHRHHRGEDERDAAVDRVAVARRPRTAARPRPIADEDDRQRQDDEREDSSGDRQIEVLHVSEVVPVPVNPPSSFPLAACPYARFGY